MRNSFFLLALNTNPPRREANRDDQNQNILFWNRCYFGLSREVMNATFCHSSWSTLCYAPMNSIVPYTNQVLPLLEQLTPWTRDRVKLLQSSYFFRLLTPTLLTPSPLPTDILYSPQFRSHQETKGLNDRHLRSHGKIGDCEQCTVSVRLELWYFTSLVLNI